jgi:hypothetical protein
MAKSYNVTSQGMRHMSPLNMQTVRFVRKRTRGAQAPPAVEHAW